MIPKFIKIKYLILILIVLLSILAGAYLFSKSEKKIDVSKGHIDKLATMVRLCSVEIYNEMPVVDTINDKVIFAIQKQQGSIMFELENLQSDISGDTVKIILPPERVELRESTDNHSWSVIDTKAIGAFSIIRRNKISLEEENAVKRKVLQKSVRKLYDNGTVARARREGANNLKLLMENIYHKPVEVIDYTPKGSSRP